MNDTKFEREEHVFGRMNEVQQRRKEFNEKGKREYVVLRVTRKCRRKDYTKN